MIQPLKATKTKKTPAIIAAANIKPIIAINNTNNMKRSSIMKSTTAIEYRLIVTEHKTNYMVKALTNHYASMVIASPWNHVLRLQTKQLNATIGNGNELYLHILSIEKGVFCA